MKVAYNKAHVGDVLLVQLSMESIVKTAMDRAGDVAILKEETTGEVKAFNLLMQVSTYNWMLQEMWK